MGSEAAVGLQLATLERADLLVFSPFLALCTLLCFFPSSVWSTKRPAQVS